MDNTDKARFEALQHVVLTKLAVQKRRDPGFSDDFDEALEVLLGDFDQHATPHVKSELDKLRTSLRDLEARHGNKRLGKRA